ncbi:MAG TPA: phenylacetic acid degradation protein [Lachnospiraceae bacterium]|nr:phenylacetic acid degradation protein [Lachnospiraceae bacterium]
MGTKTLDEVRKLFENDRFATETGAVIDEIGDFYAKCSLKLEERHKNALGAVMGGVSFTLADFAFAVAANWQNPGVVSLSSNIAYLGISKGERLIAEARCIKNGRTASYYNISVQDELGNPVAAVTAIGYRK